MTVDEVLRNRQRELQKKQDENNLLRSQIRTALTTEGELTEQLKINQEALQFLEWFSNSRRGAVKGRIESVVTNTLRLIYGPNYKVVLDYSMKRNRSFLAILVVKSTLAGEVKREIGGFGGGVADTISVPLRIMVISGSKQTDKVCLLDECFKHIDPERVELVGEFLRVLAEDLGFQVILCSHHELLQTKAERVWFITYQDKSIVFNEKDDRT